MTFRRCTRLRARIEVKAYRLSLPCIERVAALKLRRSLLPVIDCLPVSRSAIVEPISSGERSILLERGLTWGNKVAHVQNVWASRGVETRCFWSTENSLSALQTAHTHFENLAHVLSA
jgi:hypothetical protein